MEWITILGLAAATCTTCAFLPQAIKIIKTKHTQDISLGMYIVMTTGILLWLMYGLAITNIPIIAANAVTITFTVTILVLKIKFR